MKSQIAAVLVLLAAAPMFAKDQPSYEKGTISAMNAVECGYDSKSGEGLGGMILGTDSSHVKNREVLCQEYTLKTEKVTYRIRPREEKHPALLPVGETAQFRIKKDVLLLRLPEVDSKEHSYQVVGMTANPGVEQTTHPSKGN
jgi:hypothetical protein